MNFPTEFQPPDCIKKILLCTFIFLSSGSLVAAQDTKTTGNAAGSSDVTTPQVVEQVRVEPDANDEAIDQRLTKILEATGWFSHIAVRVEQGVVFLDGRTELAANRSWAGELAGKVIDVMAVVNRIEVIEHSPWDIHPAVSEMSRIWKKFLQDLPRYGLGLAVLILVGIMAKIVVYGVAKIIRQHFNPLLRDVTARLAGILVFLVGIYLALQVAGLSGLSATVLGGTGIAGLVAGIAFRDLLENYLASILISIRNPFRIGDFVEIMEHIGIVQRVTTRGTVLMNPDGNHVQIPNAMVYKSIIRNYTANPNRREMFEVGIGFDNNLSFAQATAFEVLHNHPAVKNEPEPLVLVDRLGAATIILKIFFWYDGSSYNGMKVRSSLIRLVKNSFEEEKISMPDEAREILFPEGVPVHMLKPSPDVSERELGKKDTTASVVQEAITTEAEGSLESGDMQLRDQARMSRLPEQGPSLLEE